MKRMLTSCFGLGFMPIASGTWGSLPVPVIFGLMCYFEASMTAVTVTMLIIAAVFSYICIAFAPAAIEASGKKDPSEVVADEVAGQALAFLFVPLAATTKEIVIIAVIGFLAFRFFDILKPYPCKNLEKLPAGKGILADDLAAGLYASIVLQIAIAIFM